MTKDHFQIAALEALPDLQLRLTYADGQTFNVNLQPWIKSTRALRALKDASVFAKAKIGMAGRSVDWIDDGLDLGSDNLRNLATEQLGGIGHERIWNWLHETGLTLEQAAKAIGLSRRMLIYYRDGEKAIPRSVWLACLGWEAVRPTGASLPEHIPTAREYAQLHA